MASFAVGTPTRLSKQFIASDNRFDYQRGTDDVRSSRAERGRSFSFDEDVKARNDELYHASPERTGSKQRLSPDRHKNTLRRSHSVIGSSPERRGLHDPRSGDLSLQSMGDMTDHFNARSHGNQRTDSKRSLDDPTKDKENVSNNGAHARGPDVSSDYVVDALSRRKKKNNNGQLMVRWILDRDCQICFQCHEDFGVVKRRHHCRACGGVFCGTCSRWKKKLPHLGYTEREARVCKWCYEDQYLAEKCAGRASETMENTLLKGNQRPVMFTKVAPKWVDDFMSENCQQCAKGFGHFVRRHHCRGCGALTCHACTLRKISMPEFGYLTPVRACVACSSPKILSISTVKTTGGLIEITGRNLGTMPETIVIEGGARVQPCVDVEVLVPGHKLRCRVPPGQGSQNPIRVTVCKLNGAGTFAYSAPCISSTTAVYTRGGELTVTGENFGAERDLLLVEWFNNRLNTWCDATGVELLVPHRIFKCQVGAGIGSHALLRIAVSDQSVKGTFAYMSPQIVETTPVSSSGGRIDIVGLNFGATATAIEVEVEGAPCSGVQIIVPHTKISCLVPRCPSAKTEVSQHGTASTTFSYHSRRGRDRSDSGDYSCDLIVSVDGQKGVGHVRYVNAEQVATIAFAKNISKLQSAPSLLDTSTTVNRRRHILEKAPWLPSENVLKCMICEGAFGWINRKHHCRNCGIVICGHCSSNTQYVAAYQSMQRVCKKCFRVILSDREEMEVLHAEMEHVHTLRSVEVGKQVQLQQQLSLLRLQSSGGNRQEIEKVEALLREQERRAEGKQVRYDQLHARLRHLELALSGKSNNNPSGLLQDRVGGSMVIDGCKSSSSGLLSRREGSTQPLTNEGVGKYDSVYSDENADAEVMQAMSESPSSNDHLSSTPPRTPSPREHRKASPPIPVSLPREVIAVAKEESEKGANQVLESSGLLRGRALSDYTLPNMSQSPVRSWVGASKVSEYGEGKTARTTPVWVRRMKSTENTSNYGHLDFKSTLIVAKYRGNKCVLNELPMTDEGIRKKIEREVAVRGMFRPPLHPGIAPLDAVFYDNSTARMYMHYSLNEVGTMADWLQAAKPEPWDIQSVFQQLFSALTYVHSHQIAHRNLSLDTVYVGIVGDASGEMARPFISDFSNAEVILLGANGKNTLPKPSMKTEKKDGDLQSPENDYRAPEVVCGEVATFESDLWSIGVMLYKATFGLNQQPVALGGLHARIPETKNPRLRELLASVLRVNPAERLSAQGCTAHPFFMISFAREMHESGNIISTEEKILSFRNYLQSLPRPDAVQFLRLRRTHLVMDVLERFQTFSIGNLQKRLIVMYENEPGVDAGGLTKDMYCRFFDGLLAPKAGFFVSAGGGNASSSSRGHLYLPCGSDTNVPLAAFESLGKVLAKVIFDGQTIAAPFPASFFKQLLGLPVAFRDLEEYDHELYRQLYSNVLNKELTPEYSQALSLDFHGLVDGGADRPVTDSNKREYLRLVAVQKLVGERAPQFEALVRGFNIFRFHSHLHRFNASDLMVLISGPTDITADMVLDNVDFNHGNWRNSKTLDHVRQYIRSLSPSKIKEFLQFATGSPSLPLGGLGQVAEEEQPSMGKITFTRLPKSNRLPEAHTCFNCIDLSDYQDYNILERNFEIAIGNYAETFDLL